MDLKVGFYIPSLNGGGAQRVALNLAQGLLTNNCQVDLILVQAEGQLLDSIPSGVNVVNLDASRTLTSIPRLALHLSRIQYDTVVSFMNYVNICAVVASRMACKSPELVLTEHNTVSRIFQRMSPGQRAIRRRLIRLLYPCADHIIAVSRGVARDLKEYIGLNSVQSIPNPVSIDDTTSTIGSQSVPHAWFQDSEVVILGAGRLTEQKEFSTLIRALSYIRDKGRTCRLIIIGEGEAREDLESLIHNLGLEGAVSLPGFVKNPYDFMRAADVFVLSSRWEGFGNVLVEAMACGTPVVSTDCPNGPAEILEEGKWGRLVPVADDKALAQAIIQTLDDPPVSTQELVQRAKDFSPEKIANQYLAVMLKS